MGLPNRRRGFQNPSLRATDFARYPRPALRIRLVENVAGPRPYWRIIEGETVPDEQPQPLKRCCGNCRFWLPDGTGGQCHGGPPTAVLITQRNPITGAVAPVLSCAWPPTGPDELCGVYSPRTPKL